MAIFDKVNLGAGGDIRNGFLNIDIQPFQGINVVSDVRDLFFIDDESVNFIVAQHLIEYVPRKDMVPMFLEWKRILTKDGRLEIRAIDLSQITKALYLHNVSTEMGMSDEMVISLLYGKQSNEYDLRQNGFTPSFLQGVLVGCGFSIENSVIEDLDFILTVRKQ